MYKYTHSYIVRGKNEFKLCQKYLFSLGYIWISQDPRWKWDVESQRDPSEVLMMSLNIDDFDNLQVLVTKDKHILFDENAGTDVKKINFSTILREQKLERILR